MFNNSFSQQSVPLLMLDEMGVVSFTQPSNGEKIFDLSDPWYNPVEGTFLIDFELNTTTANQTAHIFNVNDGTATNNTALIKSQQGNNFVAVVDGQVSNMAGGVVATGTRFRVALAYKSGSNEIYINGRTIANSVFRAKTLSTVMTDLVIGADALGTNPSDITVAWCSYYPRRLHDLSLEQLSYIPGTLPQGYVDLIDEYGLYKDVAYSRASSAGYFDSQGVYRTVASNILRYGSVKLGGPVGYIHEASEVNSCLQSDGLNLWEANDQSLNVTATSSADARFGTIWTLDEGTNTGLHALVSDTTTEATTNGMIRLYECYLKAGTASKVRITYKNSFFNVYDAGINVDLVAGTAVANGGSAASNVTLTATMIDGWYRLSFAVTYNGASNFRVFTVQMVDNVFSLAGLSYTGTNRTIQVVFPSILTVSSAVATNGTHISTGTGTSNVTRAVDVSSVNPISGKPYYNASAGTFYVDQTPTSSAASFQHLFSLTDSTSNDNAIAVWNQTGSVYRGAISAGAATQMLQDRGAWTAGVAARAVLAYQANNSVFATSILTTLATDTVVTLPVVDRLVIGDTANGSNPYSGIYRRLRLFKTRLDNATLAGMIS